MSYFGCALRPDQTEKIVKEAVRRLRQVERIGIDGANPVKYNAIAFTGGSGAAIAPTLAYLLKKFVIVVRKKEQDSHSGKGAVTFSPGLPSPCSYIIVDDFSSSGSTLRFVANQVKECSYRSPAPQLVGVYLYKDTRTWVEKHLEKELHVPYLHRRFTDYIDNGVGWRD